MPADPNGAPDTGSTSPSRSRRDGREGKAQDVAPPNGSDAGTAATVRDAESLVQIEVRDVATEPARIADPDHGVEIGAVDVYLSAVLMHYRTDFTHILLEHTVSRRVGDHDRGKVVADASALSPQILDIDIARTVDS